MTAEPEVVVHRDAGELAAAVADRFLAHVAAEQSGGGLPHVGLTGGGIADAVHRQLRELAPGSGVDWSRVALWWGDERFVAADSGERNAVQARRALLDHVDVDERHVHEMPAADAGMSLERAASAYSELVRRHGGELDLLMLGLGPDGHTASLFPHHAALDLTDEVAVAVRDSPKPPPERLTLTLAALNRSRRIWVVVSGEDKAEAVARALGGADVHDTPASGVRGALETLWFLDEPAASRLPR